MRTKSGLPKRKALRRMPIFRHGFRANPALASSRAEASSAHATRVSAVSFFAGCGGLDLGAVGGFRFHDTWYPPQPITIIGAYDNDAKAIETYRLNLGDDAHIVDLTEVDMQDIPAADILFGGFPCQDFSSCGHKRGFAGPRGMLYRKMVDYMQVHRPKIVVGENVPLLKGMREGELLATIKRDLEAAGYRVKHWFLNCPDYGLPASRRRIFIICVRDDLVGFPASPVPTHVMNPVTIDQALDDLICVEDESVCNQSQYFVATKATAGAGQGDQTSIRGKLGYAVRANAKARIHFHYALERRLTVRELARLQSFPDEFVFPFATGVNVMQIGNAVPPIIGHAVTGAILAFLAGQPAIARDAVDRQAA